MAQIVGFIFTLIYLVLASPFILYEQLKVEIFNHTAHPTQTLSIFECSSSLEWKILSRNALSAPDPEMGTHSSEDCVSIALYKNGSLLFTTDSNNYCAGTVAISRDYAYHDALQQTSALQDKADADTASQCLARNLSPNGNTGTPNNFQKTISLPTTSSFITIFPGQSAEGTINGQDVKLSVDATKSPNLNGIPGGHYSYHFYVNGKETNSNSVGDVMIQPWNQYGDGSVRWDVSYPDPNGRHHVP
jgi:hypothetical protein